MSDDELYRKAKLYGQNALLWRQKFIGLLPEVNKRRLYEKKGFGSIFEFAFKLAGLSEKQVRRVLNLERKFESMPVLKAALESGAVSVNKLARVASIASVDNQEELAEVVKVLPQSSLETFVRDENGPKSVRAHTLELNAEVQEKLLVLQSKGIDVNAELMEFLARREKEIAEEKTAIVDVGAKSRRIPMRVRRVLMKEFGTKCSMPNCLKPANEVHHTRPFAMVRSHDPHYLAPLCKEHHQIAHTINLRVQQRWR